MFEICSSERLPAREPVGVPSGRLLQAQDRLLRVPVAYERRGKAAKDLGILGRIAQRGTQANDGAPVFSAFRQARAKIYQRDGITRFRADGGAQFGQSSQGNLGELSFVSRIPSGQGLAARTVRTYPRRIPGLRWRSERNPDPFWTNESSL